MEISPLLEGSQVLVATSAPSWYDYTSLAFTLLGAFGGALVGAWGGYRASLKAGNSLLRREKLEEALWTLNEVNRSTGSFIHQLHFTYRKEGSDAAKKLVTNEPDALDLQSLSRLKMLIEIYLRDSYKTVDGLEACIYLFDMSCRNLNRINGPDDEKNGLAVFSKHHKQYLSYKQDLKKALLQKLHT
ncbi:hypothetical protein [Franzmannia qiaohouensis]|uniref:Uncharacterized protein n=1 Tax=Franzmannia qiaohouensis TaxID=1329370 RepID=A0ABU1HBM1_9GAMM|nr:hypothetical protein [Halomonas qiaohouensis]MDR5904869.1 hypothetical protein [Halomonas qiaohouensis]